VACGDAVPPLRRWVLAGVEAVYGWESAILPAAGWVPSERSTPDNDQGGIMKARDLMIPLQEYLKPDHTLREAANILRTATREAEKAVVKGLPVLDASGKMVGFLSIGDILKAVFPSYMSHMNLGDFTWDGMVETMAKKVGARKVAELMTQKVVTVAEDAPLMECIDHMLKNNVKRLPVTDKSGKVIGILYESVVFFEITKAMLDENGGSPK
jgi:CBS domain-containing protein